MPQITLGDHSFQIDLLDQKTCSKAFLQQEQALLFTLLIEREKEFSFNPDIVVHYPEAIEHFLQDPVSYIAELIAHIKTQKNKAVSEVVILTTYGNKLISPLSADGYKTEKIDMPAGPDHTFKFSKMIFSAEKNAQHCKLYIEAVNEQDEKIQPTFIVKLTDNNGILRGGMSGSVHEVNGELFAYIATVVVDKSAPKSTGSMLAKTTLDYLKQEGVKCANLGTQTAGRFYEKQGFHISHSIIQQLRSRIAEDRSVIDNDLVIMIKRFS